MYLLSVSLKISTQIYLIFTSHVSNLFVYVDNCNKTVGQSRVAHIYFCCLSVIELN